MCSHCHSVLTYLHIPGTMHPSVCSCNLWASRWNLTPVDCVLALYKSQLMREHTGGRGEVHGYRVPLHAVMCSRCHSVLTYLYIPATMHPSVCSCNLWANRWNLTPIDFVLVLYKSQLMRERTGWHNVTTCAQPVNQPHTWVPALCIKRAERLSRDQSLHKLHVCAAIITIEI